MALVVTTAIGVLAALAVVAQILVPPMVRRGRRRDGACVPLVAPPGAVFGDAAAIIDASTPDPAVPARTRARRTTGQRGHGLRGRPAHA